MIVLGLTGSIGMGKSTTAQMFRDQNIRVYDADKTVHDLYANEAVIPVQRLFPAAVINGKVDRKQLGALVLNDSSKMKDLEKIVHPMVHKKEQDFIARARNDKEFMVVLDIPLLFETGGENRVDAILVVTADEDIQRQRVLGRADMNEQKFNAILRRQLSDSDKRKRADFIIDTGQGMQSARQQVADIISHFKNKTGYQARPG